MSAVEVLTFGCRLNAVESEAMRGLAERAGHRGAVLVNTCAVTAEAEKQARKAIRAAHRRDPAAPILVTGCAAQIAPEAWASLPGVVRVVPNPDKLRPEAWTRDAALAPPSPGAPRAAADPYGPLRGADAPDAPPPSTGAPRAAPGPEKLQPGERAPAAPPGHARTAPDPGGPARQARRALHPDRPRSRALARGAPEAGTPRPDTPTGDAPPPSHGHAASAPDKPRPDTPAGDAPPPGRPHAAIGLGEHRPEGRTNDAAPPSHGRTAIGLGEHRPEGRTNDAPPRPPSAARAATDPGEHRPGAGARARRAVPPPAPGAATPVPAAPAARPAPATVPFAAGPGEGRTRAFLQVQGGCGHACTFCVIPRGRGPSFSVPADALAARLRRLVEEGHKEAVLTGVDIASYGADLPGRPSLGAAVRRLMALVPELPRLRLSSLDPAALDDELWRLLAEEPRLMPHLHLSLQHGADLVLKRMRRRHGRADALLAARRARDARPGIALGADLIAGFPTETEAHHRDTLDLVEEMGLSFLHVFPYSERPGTPAARMPPVPVPLRRERAARLRDAGAAAAARFYAGRVGREETVLFEAGNRGRTEHFAPLRLADGAAPVPRGALRRVRATAADADGLLATPAAGGVP